MIADGKIHEVESPHLLLQNPASRFYRLVEELGLTEVSRLRHVAKEKYENKPYVAPPINPEDFENSIPPRGDLRGPSEINALPTFHSCRLVGVLNQLPTNKFSTNRLWWHECLPTRDLYPRCQENNVCVKPPLPFSELSFLMAAFASWLRRKPIGRSVFRWWFCALDAFWQALVEAGVDVGRPQAQSCNCLVEEKTLRDQDTKRPGQDQDMKKLISRTGKCRWSTKSPEDLGLLYLGIHHQQLCTKWGLNEIVTNWFIELLIDFCQIYSPENTSDARDQKRQ